MMYCLTAPLLTSGIGYGYVTVLPAKAVIRPLLTISRIKDTVAAYYDITLSSLNSDRRARSVARPRQVAMYLAKELTPKSLPCIGREFNRDHTTVIHALKTVEALKLIDGDIDDDIRELRARLAA